MTDNVDYTRTHMQETTPLPLCMQYKPSSDDNLFQMGCTEEEELQVPFLYLFYKNSLAHEKKVPPVLQTSSR
ncbi:hypothetical protein NECAME_13589 [Necator americanus]|uniref:Uncharacterized protein n=1 Tax=Necator americanus TaxID=51031 RepID=W2STW0_NECAM|nr:hypothetical protein NECAME_13589 [Necator americanus]ETN73189.1 hypothetical protein NECAME_13589 [Necator americanus]